MTIASLAEKEVCVRDPISEPLRKRLIGEGICSPRALSNAGRRIAQLPSDLPVFDSIWLDALVRDGALTTYQARVLEGLENGPLALGKHQVLARLDRDFLCVTQDRHTKRRARLLSSTVDPELLTRSKPMARAMSPYLAEVVETVKTPTPAVFVDHQPGPTLRELLVRRGRFPVDVVMAICCQICDGLAALNHRGLNHGELHLHEVILTPGGVCRLLFPGVENLLHPSFSIQRDLPACECEGVAPELLRGQLRTPVTNMYSLGCLMWHLLAGRPVFLSADPLEQLACHQQETRPALLDLVPGLPNQIATIVERLISHDPSSRIASAAELRKKIPLSDSRTQQILRAFSSRFQLPVPGTSPRGAAERKPFRLVAGTAAILLLGGVIYVAGPASPWLSLAHSKLQSPASAERQPGSLAAAPATASPATGPGSASKSNRSEDTLLKLPAPDKRGVISLVSGGRYRADRLNSLDKLHMQGDLVAPAVIEVSQDPLVLIAKDVVIEGVTLVATQPSPFLMNIKSETFSARSVRLELRDARGGIGWKCESNSQLGLIDVCSFGPGPCLVTDHMPRTINVEHFLKVGDGAVLSTPMEEGETAWKFRHLTTRDSGSIVEFQNDSARSLLELRVVDSVISTRGEGSILTAPPRKDESAQRMKVKIVGAGTVIPPGQPLVTRRRSLGPGVTNADEDCECEGVVVGEVSFRGPASNAVADSAVLDCDAPRTSPDLPGAEIGRMPIRRPAVPRKFAEKNDPSPTERR